MTSVQLFAFNTGIAKELKERITDEALRAPLKFVPSEYQQAIFNWVRDGRGSGIVRAVAGSGKTTTIIASLRFIPGIAAKDIRASTFHSVGFAAVAKKLNVQNIQTDANKVRRLARETLTDRDYELYADFSVKLVGYAKGVGVGPLTPDLPAVWFDIVQHHDLYLDNEDASEDRAVEIARDLLRRSNQWANCGQLQGTNLFGPVIDFDDMLYLPLLWRCRLWQNDYVFIDEAQDTSPVRRAIAKLALKPGGRLVAVGDERQAIYGFTGASADAMALIQQEFNCVELPLTVSYRCPKAVAERVQGLVSYFQVPDTAKTGEVKVVGYEDALKLLGPHDAVLCRQTAPLVEMAFNLIGRGVGCVVLGKDIGAGLVALVNKQKAKGLEHLVAKLDNFLEREVAKYTAKGEEGKAEQVSDRVTCIMTVIDHLDENSRTVPALIRRIESMFSDSNGVLTLATMHKAKGREWDRVAILRPELVPSKWARQDWQYQQELNLQYVAWTRPKDLLIEIVEGAKP